MNNFEKLLQNGMVTQPYHDYNGTHSIVLEKKEYTFTISVPFSLYRDKTNDPKMQKDYSKRDKKTAEQMAYDLLKNEVGRPPVHAELNINFNKFDKEEAIFDVEIKTSDEDYLSRVKKTPR